MESSIFIAKLLGPYAIIMSIGIMFNLTIYKNIIRDFLKNSALLYLGGIFMLVFGLLIILFHNFWVFDWFVVITILGWLGLIKGILLIVYPNCIIKISKAYLVNNNLLLTHSAVIFIIGLILIVFGYFI